MQVCPPLAPTTVTPAFTTVNRQVRATAPPRDPWRVERLSVTIHAGDNPAGAQRTEKRSAPIQKPEECTMNTDRLTRRSFVESLGYTAAAGALLTAPAIAQAPGPTRRSGSA